MYFKTCLWQFGMAAVLFFGKARSDLFWTTGWSWVRCADWIWLRIQGHAVVVINHKVSIKHICRQFYLTWDHTQSTSCCIEWDTLLESLGKPLTEVINQESYGHFSHKLPYNPTFSESASLHPYFTQSMPKAHDFSTVCYQKHVRRGTSVSKHKVSVNVNNGWRWLRAQMAPWKSASSLCP